MGDGAAAPRGEVVEAALHIIEQAIRAGVAVHLAAVAEPERISVGQPRAIEDLPHEATEAGDVGGARVGRRPSEEGAVPDGMAHGHGAVARELPKRGEVVARTADRRDGEEAARHLRARPHQGVAVVVEHARGWSLRDKFGLVTPQDLLADLNLVIAERLAEDVEHPRATRLANVVVQHADRPISIGRARGMAVGGHSITRAFERRRSSQGGRLLGRIGGVRGEHERQHFGPALAAQP